MWAIMTAAPAARRILDTTYCETLLIRPCTTCWARATTWFHRVTKKLPMAAPAPPPVAGVSCNALNTDTSVLCTKLDTVEQGASKKPMACSARAPDGLAGAPARAGCGR